MDINPLDGIFVCQECGQEKKYQNNWYSDPIPTVCPDCKNKPVEFTCELCATKFSLKRADLEYLDGKVVCEVCRTKEIEAEIQRRKDEAIQGQLEAVIPAHFRNIDTDKEATLEKSLGKSLYITGRAGTGKSVFMYSLAKRYIRAGEPVKVIRFTSWVMEMQSLFRNEKANPFNEARQIAAFKGVLFIDDLGSEKITEYVRQLIYFILDEREQGNLTTVITSNLTLDEIDVNIDKRSSSRILGMCEVLKTTGEDRRIKRGKS